MRPLSRAIPVIALLAFANVAAADPPPCMRWQNDLSVCEALGTGPYYNCPQDPEDLEGTPDIETFNGLKYGSNAQKACRQLVTKMNPPAWNFVSSMKVKACRFVAGDDKCYEDYESPFHPPDDGAVRHCVYDHTGGPRGEPDNVIDWKDATVTQYRVNYLSATPDAHCFCTANGPYTDLPYEHEAETGYAIEIAWLSHAFPKGLKTAVLANNFTTNTNQYISDAKLDDVNWDPHEQLQKDNLGDPDAAEIDHIIPRKDSKGCRCGPPTPNNAAVVSKEINGLMLNFSPLFNEMRAKMFEEYVTCPNAATARFTGRSSRLTCGGDQGDSSQYDESIMDVEFEVPPRASHREVTQTSETGGCSAGGLTGLGVALSLLGLRRRRVR
jgi:hypothetical protein